jgi:hypothetical protein
MASTMKNEPASDPLHADQTPLVENNLALTASARSSTGPVAVAEIVGGRGE